MKIGGLNKFSLSDYPGKTAAVVFTQGCNFRCPWCHNGSLLSTDVAANSLIPEQEILEFLDDRNNQLDGVVISGGEPTIQPDLSKFIHRIKEVVFAVKLDTNGSKPKVLQMLLENKLIDFIAMDIKAPLDIYDRLTGVKTPVHRIRESIELIAASGIAHEYRTTVVNQLLSPKELSVIKKLVPASSKHRFQKFCPEHALKPALRAYIKQSILGDE